MSFKEFLEERKGTPKIGDLVYTPKSQKTSMTNDVGIIEDIQDGYVYIRIGGPVAATFPLSDITSSSVYKDKNDPGWNGKTIWKTKN